MARLRIATCQFPVSADIARNARYVSAQLQVASERGARVAHFPEACLSGYAGADLPSYEGFDWEALRSATVSICRTAAELGMWVILGSTHPLSNGHKPHNSLYVISDAGEVVDRYDKRFCGGVDEVSGDL